MGQSGYPEPVGDLSDQAGGGLWGTMGSDEDDTRSGIGELSCPYGHGPKWVFVRYGREYVCGRCGVRFGVVGGNGVRT